MSSPVPPPAGDLAERIAAMLEESQRDGLETVVIVFSRDGESIGMLETVEEMDLLEDMLSTCLERVRSGAHVAGRRLVEAECS